MAATDPNCLFCKIVKGDIPCQKLHETDDIVVFLDIGPIAKGHCLVVPKYHAECLNDLPDEYLTKVLVVAKEVILSSPHIYKNYNILQNNGKIAGQIIPHVHFHIIPKPSASEGLKMEWKSLVMSSEELDSLATDIREVRNRWSAYSEFVRTLVHRSSSIQCKSTSTVSCPHYPMVVFCSRTYKWTGKGMQISKERRNEVLRLADHEYKRGQVYYNQCEYRKSIRRFARAISLAPGVAKFFFSRANGYRMLDDYQRAIFDYSMAIHVEPKTAVHYGNRGICFRKLGRLEDAMADYSKAQALDTNCETYYYNRGLVNFDLENYEEAISDYSRAIEINPFNFKAYFNRGNCYRRVGQLSLSASDLERAVDLENGSASAHNNLGLSYFELGQYQKASKEFSQAIDIEGDNPVHYKNRGLAAFQSNNFRAAVDDFTVSINLDPVESSYYFNRGNAYRSLRSYEKSLEDLDMALRLSGSSHQYLHCRGLTQQEMGNVAGALKTFGEALEIKPDYVPSLYHKALMLHRNYKYMAAIDVLTAIVTLDHRDRRIFEARGLVYQDLLDQPAAVEDFTRAIELSGEDKYWTDYYYRGISYLKMEKFSRALEDFSEAQNMGADDTDVLNAKALALKGLGQGEEAVDALSEALQRSKNNKLYLFNRSQAYFSLGDFQSASRDLLTSLSIRPSDPRTLYWLGKSYFALKDFGKCVQSLRMAIENDAHDNYVGDCHYVMGLAFVYIGRLPEGIACLSKAIEMRPECAHFVHERAKAYQDNGENDEAVADFSRVLELQPHNARAYFRRAFSLKALDHFDAAAKDFEVAKRLEPADPAFLVNYRKIGFVESIELCPPGHEEEYSGPDEANGADNSFIK